MSEHETSAPAPATASAPAGEEDQGGSFALGVLCTLVGLLLLLLFLFTWMGQGGLGAEATGVVFQNAQWVLAVGAGLTVLGLGLLAGRAWDFLNQRRGTEALGAVLNAALGLALLVLVNYVFARHDLWRWDLTRDRLYSLSDEAKAAARALPSPIKVWLISAQDPAVNTPSEVDAVRVMLEGLAASSDKVTLKVTRPLDAMSREELTALLEELENPSVRSGDDLHGVVIKLGRMGEKGWETQGTRTVPWRELWESPPGPGRGGKKTFKGEQRVLSALRELVEPERPRVYFLEGHDERRMADFDRNEGLSSLAQRLKERHVQVESLRLADRPGHQVPADARLLILPGPRLGLPPEEARALQAWLDQGGDAIFLLEPVTDSRGGRLAWGKTGLEEQLEQRWGLRVENSVVWLAGVDQYGNPAVSERVATAGYGAGDHPIVAELARLQSPVELNGARVLQLVPAPGVEQRPLIELRAPPGYEDSLLAVATTRKSEVLTMMGEKGGPFLIGAALERKLEDTPAADQKPRKVSRLVVLGDVDLATNATLGAGRNRNLELMLNAVSWAMEREEQVVGKAARAPNYRLEMQRGQLEFFSLIALLGMPILAIALGVVAWLIRH